AVRRGERKQRGPLRGIAGFERVETRRDVVGSAAVRNEESAERKMRRQIHAGSEYAAVAHISCSGWSPFPAQIVAGRGEAFVVITAVGERVGSEKRNDLPGEIAADEELVLAAEAPGFNEQIDRVVSQRIRAADWRVDVARVRRVHAAAFNPGGGDARA